MKGILKVIHYIEEVQCSLAMLPDPCLQESQSINQSINHQNMLASDGHGIKMLAHTGGGVARWDPAHVVCACACQALDVRSEGLSASACMCI